MHDEQSITGQDGDIGSTATPQEHSVNAPEPTPEIVQSTEAATPTPTPVHAEPAPEESSVPAPAPESSAVAEVTATPEPAAAPTEAAAEAAPAEQPAAAPAAKQEHQPSKRAKLSPEFLERWKELQDAQRERKQIEMRVVRKIKGGTILDYKGLDVFMPFSHWHLGPEFSDQEIDNALGKAVSVRVIEVSAPEKGRAVASRRKMLMEERCASFKEGMALKGKVSGITSFGIFVDLGGVEGLVHISQLAPHKIQNPSAVMKVGDEITVSIYKIDQKRGRVWLNLSDFAGGPWKEAAAKYGVGTIHMAKVVLLKKYGIFVELEPMVEAFVHVQELSWTRRVKDPADVYKVGQEIEVKILKLKEAAHKIEASVKQVKESPWVNFATTYRKGATCEGKVKEVVEKGAVIELPDDVDGFLPRSKMMQRGSDVVPELKVGDVLNLRVVDFSAEQQFIILGIKYENPNPEGQRGPRGPREERRGGDRDRGPRRDDRPRGDFPVSSGARPTLGELISEKIRKKLTGSK